jgi:hypothetical protein
MVYFENAFCWSYFHHFFHNFGALHVPFNSLNSLLAFCVDRLQNEYGFWWYWGLFGKTVLSCPFIVQLAVETLHIRCPVTQHSVLVKEHLVIVKIKAVWSKSCLGMNFAVFWLDSSEIKPASVVWMCCITVKCYRFVSLLPLQSYIIFWRLLSAWSCGVAFGGHSEMVGLHIAPAK